MARDHVVQAVKAIGEEFEHHIHFTHYQVQDTYVEHYKTCSTQCKKV